MSDPEVPWKPEAVEAACHQGTYTEFLARKRQTAAPIGRTVNLRAHPGLHPWWGAYAPAITRWEATLGRDAPPPTEVGRLAPRFVEWMMGLDEGWVTDVGLSRPQQLKALGNGVVPQQAAHALERLLT